MPMSNKGDEMIEAARQHFAEKLNGEMYQVAVPEMGGTPEQPAILYFQPSTLAERDLIYRAVQAGGLGMLVEIIIVRARDEDKNKLFANKHKTFFDRHIDPDVINRIIKDLADQEGIDLEDVDEKKS